jgi:antirestriction protein
MTYTEAKEAIKASDKETLREALSNHDENVIKAALACGVNLSDIDEAYQGKWKSDEDFVQNLLEDTGSIPKDLPGFVYIDWERTARDVMYDYCSDNWHYFRNL